MGIFLGVEFNTTNHVENCYQLFSFADVVGKKIQIIQLPHVDLLEVQLGMIDVKEIERIILTDYEELGDFYSFKQFHNTCSRFSLSYSILKQDLHSDVDLPVAYLMDVF